MSKLLLLVLVVLGTASGAESSPPRLHSPGAETASSNPFPRFRWERLPGTLDPRHPVTYEVEIVRDSERARVVRPDQVHLARYILDQPLPEGAYAWHVRAYAAEGGPSAWSAWSTFRILPPDETILVDLRGPGEALPALRAAFQAGSVLSRQGRSVRIEVPRNRYVLSPGAGTEMDASGKDCLELRDAANITVDFGGSSFAVQRWGIGFLRMDRCHDIAICNATVDWDREIPFTQAIVTAKDDRTGKVALLREEGFPDYDVPYAGTSDGFSLLMDPRIPGRMKSGTPIHFAFERRDFRRSGDRSWDLEVPERWRGYFAVGDRLITMIRGKGGRPLCNTYDSDAITYSGITSYTTGGSGHYTSFNDSQLAILHCRELIKPGRWFGGSADGVHAKAGRIGPWIDDLTIDGIGDDGVALYARPAKIHAAHVDGNPRTFLFIEDSFNLGPGDQVVFFNPRRGIYYADAQVASVAVAGGYYRVVFDRDVPFPERIGDDLKLADQVWNRSRSCGDFMVRNSRLTHIRRFGIVARAQGGVIERNHIEGTSSSGILSINEPWWPNGPMSSNLVIQDNAVLDTCFDLTHPFGAIALRTMKYPTEIADGQGPYDILIRRNTITDWRRFAVNISGARNIVLRDNTVAAGSQPFIHAENIALNLQRAQRVVLRNLRLEDLREGIIPRMMSEVTEVEERTDPLP